MPCTKALNIDTTQKVVVTGATGYVAGQIIQQLLEAGVTVHATVSGNVTTARFQYLQDLADASAGSIHFFTADLTQPGSVQQAMQGTSIVFYTACPFSVVNDDTESNDKKTTVTDPSTDVAATKNVLRQASQTPTVQRVVMTSSAAAIYGHAADCVQPTTTEASWNNCTLDTSASPYGVSKTLAEQTAWDMAGRQTQYKLVVLNPAFILGPGVAHKTHPTEVSFQVMQTIGGGACEWGVLTWGVPVVDVRDVAAAHLAAAYKPDASGRYILSGENTDFGQVGLCLQDKYDSGYPVPRRSCSIPRRLGWLLAPLFGLDRRTVYRNLNVKTNLDNTKAKEQLDMKFRPLKRTVEDMVGYCCCCTNLFRYHFIPPNIIVSSLDNTVPAND